MKGSCGCCTPTCRCFSAADIDAILQIFCFYKFFFSCSPPAVHQLMLKILMCPRPGDVCQMLELYCISWKFELVNLLIPHTNKTSSPFSGLTPNQLAELLYFGLLLIRTWNCIASIWHCIAMLRIIFSSGFTLFACFLVVVFVEYVDWMLSLSSWIFHWLPSWIPNLDQLGLVLTDAWFVVVQVMGESPTVLPQLVVTVCVAGAVRGAAAVCDLHVLDLKACRCFGALDVATQRSNSFLWRKKEWGQIEAILLVCYLNNWTLRC
jgi:hypothetical protein